jgi:hypothetical protein
MRLLLPQLDKERGVYNIKVITCFCICTFVHDASTNLTPYATLLLIFFYY